MNIKGKSVYKFRHLAAMRLMAMGLDEALVHTFTGYVRNSNSTNEYNILAERLKDNEIARNYLTFTV